MQRCCARIAGPTRIACRGHSPLPLTFRRYYAKPRHDFDYARIIGADKTLSRQALVRQERAWREGGFGFIHEAKLPRRSDCDRIESWLPFIDAALPRRLRLDATASSDPSKNYSPQDISRILSIAGTRHGHDLLTHLAVDKNRWKAVVWLITQVVDHNFKPESSPPSADNIWNHRQPPNATLVELTRKAVHLDPVSDPSPATARPFPSLDQLTDELHALNEPLPAMLRQAALGQVWQSLGFMIVADAARDRPPSDETIRPEILEIIALLHHRGAMPSSIYSYQPAENSSALRQPPTLHLLSNQIITSLTDAAWRAHETLVVEEAKEKGGVYASMRPEIPGSMYKVRVAGLGHEVWLELVLWSCLHGRFYAEGAAILELIGKQKSPAEWSVLSWRELALPYIQAGQERSINWDEVSYLFNTGASQDDRTVNKKKVQRTVSSEVISAFVDGLVSDVRRGVGARGISPANILKYLISIKHFLELDRNNMSLGFTSWDAIVLRFIDSQGIDIDQDPGIARRIVALSSRFGDEIDTVNAPTRDEVWQPTPAYVLDGSAANLGLMHRILRAYVQLGSLRGAIPIFWNLQKMTDLNKRRSILEFFANQQNTADKQEDDTVNFEDRFSGIEYPNFFPQIPVTILAPFLDLVVKANAFDFGSWLLHSDDIDGPIIPESLYGDPVMGPPLVRLAATMGDKNLLVKIFERQKRARNGSLPEEILTTLMEYQVEEQNWQFVNKALENFSNLPRDVGYSIGMHTVAVVIRSVLREAKSCKDDLQSLEKLDSSKVFRKMIGTPIKSGTETFSRLAGRTWRLLACINDEWRDYAWKVFPSMKGLVDLKLSTQPFNIILSGIVDTYGSETGKRILGTFWKKAHKSIDLLHGDQSDDSGGVSRMPASRADTNVLTSVFNRSPFDTNVILINGPENKQARVRMDVLPDAASIRLILDQALREHDGDANLREQDVQWARQMMRRLGMRNHHINVELRGVLDKEAAKAEVSQVMDDEEAGSGEFITYRPPEIHAAETGSSSGLNESARV